jgi:hypothetical protein
MNNKNLTTIETTFMGPITSGNGSNIRSRCNDTAHPHQQTIDTHELTAHRKTRQGACGIGTTKETTGDQTQTDYNNENPSQASGTRPPFDHAAWILSLDPLGYCWSHVYRVICGHNSKDCKGEIHGYQDDATRNNTMWGSEKGKS